MPVRIITFHGDVIYEGEGEIRMGDGSAPAYFRHDLNRVHVETRRPDGVCFRLDLTGLLDTVHSDWVADFDRDLSVEPRWTLRLDVGEHLARDLREGLTLTEPERAARHEAENVVVRAVSLERRRRYLESPFRDDDITTEQALNLHRSMELLGDDPDEMAVMRAVERVGITMRQAMVYLRAMHRDIVRARTATREMSRALGIDPGDDICIAREENPWAATRAVTRYDGLIESTRAEFPHDPHAYGHPFENEMRWSPPKDGEKVPRCP